MPFTLTRRVCAIKHCSNRIVNGSAHDLQGVHQLQTQYAGVDSALIPICDWHINLCSQMLCRNTGPELPPRLYKCQYIKCKRKIPFVLNRPQCISHTVNVLGECRSILKRPSVVGYTEMAARGCTASFCVDCIKTIGNRKQFYEAFQDPSAEVVMSTIIAAIQGGVPRECVRRSPRVSAKSVTNEDPSLQLNSEKNSTKDAETQNDDDVSSSNAAAETRRTTKLRLKCCVYQCLNYQKDDNTAAQLSTVFRVKPKLLQTPLTECALCLTHFNSYELLGCTEHVSTDPSVITPVAVTCSCGTSMIVSRQQCGVHVQTQTGRNLTTLCSDRPRPLSTTSDADSAFCCGQCDEVPTSPRKRPALPILDVESPARRVPPPRLRCSVAACTQYQQGQSTAQDYNTIVYLKPESRDKPLSECGLCRDHVNHCQRLFCGSSLSETRQSYTQPCAKCSQDVTVSHRSCPTHSSPSSSTLPCDVVANSTIAPWAVRQQGIYCNRCLPNVVRTRCAVFGCASYAYDPEHCAASSGRVIRLRDSMKDASLTECLYCNQHWDIAQQCETDQLRLMNETTTVVCSNCSREVCFSHNICQHHVHFNDQNRALVLPCSKNSMIQQFTNLLDVNINEIVFCCGSCKSDHDLMKLKKRRRQSNTEIQRQRYQSSQSIRNRQISAMREQYQQNKAEWIRRSAQSMKARYPNDHESIKAAVKRRRAANPQQASEYEQQRYQTRQDEMKKLYRMKKEAVVDSQVTSLKDSEKDRLYYVLHKSSMRMKMRRVVMSAQSHYRVINNRRLANLDNKKSQKSQLLKIKTQKQMVAEASANIMARKALNTAITRANVEHVLTVNEIREQQITGKIRTYQRHFIARRDEVLKTIKERKLTTDEDKRAVMRELYGGPQVHSKHCAPYSLAQIMKRGACTPGKTPLKEAEISPVAIVQPSDGHSSPPVINNQGEGASPNVLVDQQSTSQPRQPELTDNQPNASQHVPASQSPVSLSSQSKAQAPERQPMSQQSIAAVLDSTRHHHDDDRSPPSGKDQPPPPIPCTDDCTYPDNWEVRLHDYLTELTIESSNIELSQQLIGWEQCDGCKGAYCKYRVNCKNIRQFLLYLRPHFKTIRAITRMWYLMRQMDIWRFEFYNAIEQSDFEQLKYLMTDGLPEGVSAASTTTDTEVDRVPIDEDKLINENEELFSTFESNIYNFPKYACDVCHQRKTADQLVTITKVGEVEVTSKKGDKSIACRLQRTKFQPEDEEPVRTRPTTVDVDLNLWNRIVTECELDPTTVTCCTLPQSSSCFNDIRKNLIPKLSKANLMYVEPVPEAVSALNIMEQLILSPAHFFHTIYRLQALGGRVPKHRQHQAMKGQGVFLPGAFDVTMQKILQQSGCALTSDNINIIVQGLPNESKKSIWRHLVRTERLTAALDAYRQLENPHFQSYKLPDEDATAEAVVITSEEAEQGGIQQGTSAMLTQSLPSNMEQYTIRSMMALKPDRSDIDLFQQKKTVGQPLNRKEAGLETATHPHLFPSGRFGKSAKRLRQVSDVVWLQHKLNHTDPRFRRCSRYIFMEHMLKDKRSLEQGMYAMLFTGGFKNANKAELLRKLDQRDEELELHLNVMQSKVIGSGAYWNMRRQDLIAFDNTFGPATFFLTVSIAEYEWPDMTAAMRVNNPDWAEQTDAQLVQKLAEDPFTIVEQFYRRWHSFLKLLVSGAFGFVVEQYWWRVEMQARGTPHIHCKLWVKDAPMVNVDPEETVVAFINRHITCELPNSKAHPRLSQLVERYQTHRHSKSCLRRRKNNKGLFKSVCRHKYPRPVTGKTKMAYDLEKMTKNRLRSGKRQLHYKLARSSEEQFVVQYNPLMLLNWKANMDIQYIGEPVGGFINTYITCYTTKEEKEATEDLWQTINDTCRASDGDKPKSLASRLAHLANHEMNARETGAPESCIRVNGMSMHGASCGIKYVNTDLPQNRRRKLKSERVLKEERPEATPFENNLVDVYYPRRAKRLENKSLYEIATWYRVLKEGEECQDVCECCFELINMPGIMKKKKKPLCFKTTVFSPKVETREKHFHQLLMIVVPWRDEEADLKGDHPTYEAAYEARKEELDAIMDTNPYLANRLAHDRLQELKAQWTEEVEKEAAQPEIMEESTDDFDNLLEDSTTVAQTRLTKEEVDRRADQMNEQQLAAYEIMKKSIVDRDENPDAPPLRLYISGAGGTGKSYLIEVMTGWVQLRYENSKTSPIFLCGPTGVSSFNIGGVTLHKLFKLPIQKNGIPRYTQLFDDELKEMRSRLRGCKLLIIDEISMVSNITFTMVSKRLTELFPSGDQSGKYGFGGWSIIVLGDFLQLPPVGRPKNCGYIFEPLSAFHARSAFGPIDRLLIPWLQFAFIELTQNNRQKGDPEFAKILNEIRLGKCTAESGAVLRRRVLAPSVADGGERDREAALRACADKFVELRETGQSSLCLFPTNKDADNVNQKLLLQQGQDIVELVATDTEEGPKAKKARQKKVTPKKKVSDTAGLEGVLRVAVGCRVMLRRNLDVERGLVNGSLGTVEGFKVNEGKTVAVNVSFDGLPTTEEIGQISAAFDWAPGIRINRKQFPLILAYAVSVHKCQGMSLDSAIVDAGKSIFEDSQLYVALSRVRTLNGLHLVDFDATAIRVSRKVLNEYRRLVALTPADTDKLPLAIMHRMDEEEQEEDPASALFTNEPSAKSAPPKRKPDPMPDAHPLPVRVNSQQTKGYINESGNLCFAISVLQLLLNEKIVLDLIDTAKTKMDRIDVTHKATAQSRNIRNCVTWNLVGMAIHHKEDAHSILKRDHFRSLMCAVKLHWRDLDLNPTRQQDAEEFLNKLQEGLNADNILHLSELMHIDVNRVATCLTCREENRTTETSNPEFHHMYPCSPYELVGCKSVQAMVTELTMPGEPYERNCDACGLLNQPWTNCQRIITAPRLLFIFMCRRDHTHGKTSRPITVNSSLTVNVDDFNIGYKLRGAVAHDSMGESDPMKATEHGHYRTYLFEDDKTMIECDDAVINRGTDAKSIKAMMARVNTQCVLAMYVRNDD